MKPFDIYYLPLPETIVGAVRDSGERFIIAINSTMPEPERDTALRHELNHIRLGHFDDDRSIYEIESEAENTDLSEDEYSRLLTFARRVVYQ